MLDGIKCTIEDGKEEGLSSVAGVTSSNMPLSSTTVWVVIELPSSRLRKEATLMYQPGPDDEAVLCTPTQPHHGAHPDQPCHEDCGCTVLDPPEGDFRRDVRKTLWDALKLNAGVFRTESLLWLSALIWGKEIRRILCSRTILYTLVRKCMSFSPRISLIPQHELVLQPSRMPRFSEDWHSRRWQLRTIGMPCVAVGADRWLGNTWGG